MAKLVKLHISGIRSFGPYEDHAQQLKFFSPLTLILGQNGCGKTTIIECIKYACTAELPSGSSNGQGFVNDPKMTKTSSTKGQIKLKILDPKGNEVTIVRVVEVSQGANNLRFQTKNSTLRTVNAAGYSNSISGRCADITTECCQIMNVSPAVLNNVVFCHQENSSWPLDEAKKLKDKFDEIFDADRYSKCCDKLRALIKEKENKIKILKTELGYKAEKKRQVEREKSLLQDKEVRLQSFEDTIQSRRQELGPVKERIEEIFELEKVLGDLQNQLTEKEATKKGIIEQQNTIRKSFAFEFEGSDQELQQKIRSFEKDKEKDENFILQLEERKSDVDNKSKEVASFIRKAQTELGQLNQEKSQHQKKCVERKSLLTNAKEKMGVTLALDDSNDNAKGVLRALKSETKTLEMGLNTLIKEKELEEETLQKAVDEARGNSLSIKHKITTKLTESKESKKKIQEITNELHNISASADYLKNYTKKIEAIDKTMCNLNNTFRETEESQKAEDLKKDIQENERVLDALETDYRILQQNDIIEGKLETEKLSIMEKQKEINRIKTKHSDNLKRLFAGSVPERNLKDSVLTAQKQADLTVKTLTDKLTKKQTEVTTLDVQRQNQTEKVTSCEKELKSKLQKISEVCNGRDFDEIFETTYHKKEQLQIDKGQYSSVKIIYGQFIKKFEEESPCCPICETDFKQKNGLVKKIITTLKSKLDRVPQQLAKAENDLQKEEALYSKLQQLKMVNEETRSLSQEKLPQLKHQLEEIEEKLKKGKTELEELKTQLKQPQMVSDISRTVISDVASLDQNQSDVDKSKRTVESLKENLVQVPSNKSKPEVEAEIDFLKAEVGERRRKVDAQTKKINSHRERIQKMTLERSELVESQMRLKESVQSKPMLEAQQNELTEKLSALQEEISDLEATQNLLQAELQNAVETKETVVKKNKLQIQEERTKIAAHVRIVQEIDKLQNEIDVYLNENINEKLESTENKLKEYKNKEDALQQTKSKILEAISEKKEALAKEELNFRTLQSNVTLREKKVEEKKLSDDIQALNQRIGGYNYRTVYEEKRQLVLQRENLEKEINTVLGEKNILRDAVEEMRRELAKPENTNAYKNYMSKFYELKVEEHVVNDINKFVIGLEKAVLDFHKAKMTQINKNIRELWRDIYKGNDIDYIEILTEYVTSGNRKRSYNYKVVQVKSGVSLDMRGRCSAGQKVLACIIIRMALSESLSSNCGILALDEPTTNLDRANIQGLADALSRIVSARQAEKNFQLLIITHDEEFLNTLTRVQGVSYFYRVQRDNDGFSVIKKDYAL